MIRLFLRWAAAYLDADIRSLTAKLNIHTGQDDSVCKREWSELTGIPLDSFTKSYIKPEGTGHRKNKLYRGTITVRIRNSGERLQTILGWIEALAIDGETPAVSCRPIRAASSTG